MTKQRDVFIDTEFLRADLTRSGLIALGMTDRGGTDFYAVNADMNEAAARADPWLREHVWPHLPLTVDGRLDRAHPDVQPSETIRERVAAYFEAGPKARAWAYYGAVDLLRVHALWDHDWQAMPRAVPRRQRDLADLLEDLGVPCPEQTTTAHHALNDARHDRLMYETAMGACGHRVTAVLPEERALEELSALRAGGGLGGAQRVSEELAWWIAAHAPEVAELQHAAQIAARRHDVSVRKWIEANAATHTAAAAGT